jgi:adsorption protein B
VTGIALQSWEFHGWRAPLAQLYWFWRDRKGLVGNLLSPVANLLFVYGAGGYAASLGQPGPWHFGTHIPPWIAAGCRLTLATAALQAGVRARSAALIYGWKFAAGVPVRMLWGNAVNFAATAMALWEFGNARGKGRGLVWRKTEHVYPVAVAAGARYQPIADVPTSSAAGD